MLNRLQQHIAKFCIDRPKITIFVILSLMILIVSGIRFVEQDDNNVRCNELKNISMKIKHN